MLYLALRGAQTKAVVAQTEGLTPLVRWTVHRLAVLAGGFKLKQSNSIPYYSIFRLFRNRVRQQLASSFRPSSSILKLHRLRNFVRIYERKPSQDVQRHPHQGLQACVEAS
jgi:hypothetical protein